MGAPLREREPVKSSVLIAVAASCAVLAAAGAGLASWAVVSAGQAAGSDAQPAGDDGIFVADELTSLLLSDDQVLTLGIPGSVSAVSAEYQIVDFESVPDCSYLLGETPYPPAGARGIEISDGATQSFRQQVVQFSDQDAAAATFAVVAESADQCTSFTDDSGQAWTWTTVSSSLASGLVAGYSGPPEAPDRVIVVGLLSNAMSFIYADPRTSSLSLDALASATLAAARTQLAG
jgi:hypothetical protein